MTYTGTGQYFDLKKKRKYSSSSYKPTVVKPSSHVSALKLIDIRDLLTKLGFQMNELDFYKNITSASSCAGSNTDKSSEEDENNVFINDDCF